MRLLFAAGDVGGARALLPVARLAYAEGIEIVALAHGVFQNEGDPGWEWLDLRAASNEQADAVVYATSVSDSAAMHVASFAQARGIPVIHVLDNWSNYRSRLQAKGGFRVVPDVYAVMDQLARDEAIADGVPPNILHITGHPNLAQIHTEHKDYGTPAARPINMLFVSEPAQADSGCADDPNGRGYDERTIAKQVMAEMGSPQLTSLLGVSPRILVAPHPREDRAAVTAHWKSLLAEHTGASGQPLFDLAIVSPSGVRRALHEATHVIGMSSILLYEAWLLGRPVASIQTNLRGHGLRSLSHRSGLLFCEKLADIKPTLHQIFLNFPQAAHQELRQHASASECVLNLLKHHLSL